MAAIIFLKPGPHFRFLCLNNLLKCPLMSTTDQVNEMQVVLQKLTYLK